MSGIVDSVLGSGESDKNTQTSVTKPQSQDEIELTQLNKQIAQRQLQNMDTLQPFQQKLLELSGYDLDNQLASARALNSAITPQQQAEAAKADFDRQQRLGPIQDELLQLQLDAARQGGKATPDQLAQIKAATDAGIDAGTADIDLSTKRGIGLISDELANSRGLRLSDSPIGGEAALLARGGEDQKASLIKNLRAGQASAALNYPLAASQVTSGINLSQQNVAQAAAQFQAELRSRAQANRLALSGQASNSGIGLASVGSGVGTSTLGSLTNIRGLDLGKRETGFDPAANNTGYGNFMSGAAKLITSLSDRRLKTDIEKVGELPSGIPVYSFRFISGVIEHVGVMADEVLRVIPEAVSKGKDGYYRVAYGMLR